MSKVMLGVQSGGVSKFEIHRELQLPWNSCFVWSSERGEW